MLIYIIFGFCYFLLIFISYSCFPLLPILPPHLIFPIFCPLHLPNYPLSLPMKNGFLGARNFSLIYHRDFDLSIFILSNIPYQLLSLTGYERSTTLPPVTFLFNVHIFHDTSVIFENAKQSDISLIVLKANCHLHLPCVQCAFRESLFGKCPNWTILLS